MDEDESLEITDAPHWYPPLPERGPFLGFLNFAPEEALGCILGIVDHATERWELANADADENAPSFGVVVGGEPVSLIGDAGVMHWHRGESHVPSVLASALMALEAWLYRRLDADEDFSDSLSVLIASRSVAIWGLLTEIVAYRPALLRGLLQPLITGANLLRADSLYRHQPHNYLLMPMLSDRTWAERIQSWNTMPHRTVSVMQILMSDVLSGEALGEELAVARERWRAADPEGLKHLIAQTDPANYREVVLEGGATGLAYRPPESLRDEIAQSDHETYDALFWLELPYRLREWIDARRSFTDAELEDLWSQMQGRLAEVGVAETAEPIFAEGMRSREDLECGFAALLVVCAGDWLEARPDRATWCRERLLAPFIDPPPRHEFDFPGDISTERWDFFCADALPLLWQAAPGDRDLRSAVVRLAIGMHHNTVARLFTGVAMSPALRNPLQQLETVALHWARFLAWQHERQRRRHFAEQGFEGAPSPDDLPDVETPTREALESFEADTLSAEKPRLADWLAETPDGLVVVGARRSARTRALNRVDPEYLLAAFLHLLTLDDDPDDLERQRRLRFAVDLAEYLASAMTPDDGEREVDGTPYPFERTMFEQLARLAVAVELDEARPIWQPLLRAGAPAGYWVDDFLGEVWRAALAPDEPPSTFAPLIKEMLAFAASAPNWQSGHHIADLSLVIVGLDRWTSGPVHERHARLIEELQPEWGEWVKPILQGSWSARRAVYFFGEPGADRIYEQALSWLAERERDAARTDEELDQALAEMLLKLYGRHPSLFRAEGDAAVNARFLLSRLAARGNPLALELTSQLG